MENKIPINLDSLFELSARLNETYDTQFILNSVLLSLMGKLRVFSGSVYVRSANNSELNLFISKGSSTSKVIPTLKSEILCGHCLKILGNASECEQILKIAGFESAAPVVYRGELLALVCLGKRIVSDEISPEEALYARLVTTIAAISLQNARNYSSLENAKNNIEKRNLMLNTLFEISNDFSSLLSKNEILKMLSYRLMGHLMLTKFALLLANENSFNEPIINRFEGELNPEIIELLKNVETTTLSSAILNPEYANLFRKNGIAAISPMYVQGLAKGVLIVGKKLNKEDYSEEDLQFLSALGNSAISALENERLFRQELEKKRLETEMNTALEIQKNLLPKTKPDIAGWDIFGLSIPSRQVGGDYFDFIHLDKNRLLVAIADVSGKGLPASLLMANVQAALRALTPFADTLPRLIYGINKILYENTASDKFVTFFCGYIDTSDNSFTYINAGHNPPYLLDVKNNITELNQGGLILGFTDAEIPYEIGRVELTHNDIILLYTDGINEARNPKNEEFGDDSLINVLKTNRFKNAKQICETIVNEVNAFAGSAMQYDDLTLVAIKKI